MTFILVINPAKRYIIHIMALTRIRPISPANIVVFKELSPYVASTVRDVISVNLVGRAPEFISSTRLSASFWVKLP